MVPAFHREDSTPPDWKDKIDKWMKEDTGLWVASYEIPKICQYLISIDAASLREDLTSLLSDTVSFSIILAKL